MAFVTADVIPVSGDELPFKVVFKQGETVLTEWLVESQEDGQSQIVEESPSMMTTKKATITEPALLSNMSGLARFGLSVLARQPRGGPTCCLVKMEHNMTEFYSRLATGKVFGTAEGGGAHERRTPSAHRAPRHRRHGSSRCVRQRDRRRLSRCWRSGC
jgi:hypothetical protein